MGILSLVSFLREQTPRGPGEGKAELSRRSVLMNSQRVCYADSLISNWGVAGQGVQPLGKRMKYTYYEVPQGRASDSHSSERQAQEASLLSTSTSAPC